MSIISYCTEHNRVKMKDIRNSIMLEIGSIMSTSLVPGVLPIFFSSAQS